MLTRDHATAPRQLSVVQVVRDGGGTAAVELAVAAKLAARGHRVRLYGPPEVAAPARAAGFDLVPLDWPAGLGSGIGEDLVRHMVGASAAWARRLVPVLGAGVDVLVADSAVFGAALAARLSGVPSAVLMPTVYVAASAHRSSVVADPAPAVAGLNRARTALGLPAVGSLTEQLLDADRLLLLTARAFELPDLDLPPHVRYAGPQLPTATPGPPVPLPPGTAPLVLVSLSTTDRGQGELLARLLTALGSLPGRALVTLGPAVDRAGLRAPANVTLAGSVPHGRVLPATSLVVTHAGHGTVMAAIAAGVPMVCVPMGRDQPAVAARVVHHRLGVAVDPDAGVAELRAAIRRVLGDPGYRAAATRMATTIEPADRVTTEIEAAVTGPATG